MYSMLQVSCLLPFSWLPKPSDERLWCVSVCVNEFFLVFCFCPCWLLVKKRLWNDNHAPLFIKNLCTRHVVKSKKSECPLCFFNHLYFCVCWSKRSLQLVMVGWAQSFNLCFAQIRTFPSERIISKILVTSLWKSKPESAAMLLLHWQNNPGICQSYRHGVIQASPRIECPGWTESSDSECLIDSVVIAEHQYSVLHTVISLSQVPIFLFSFYCGWIVKNYWKRLALSSWNESATCIYEMLLTPK